MKLRTINSLVELFYKKCEEINSISDKPFLKWLKDNKNDFLTWKQVEMNIHILSEYLKMNLSNEDRCVLLSENRPEWLICDIAIMNAIDIARQAHEGEMVRKISEAIGAYAKVT